MNTTHEQTTISELSMQIEVLELRLRRLEATIGATIPNVAQPEPYQRDDYRILINLTPTPATPTEETIAAWDDRAITAEQSAARKPVISNTMYQALKMFNKPEYLVEDGTIKHAIGLTYAGRIDNRTFNALRLRKYIRDNSLETLLNTDTITDAGRAALAAYEARHATK